MGDLLLSTQAAPTTPGVSTGVIYIDTNNEVVNLDVNAKAKTVRTLNNANTADVVANAANTYLTGSSILVPPALVRAGTTFSWRLAMSKTAAGVAAATITLVVGTNGTTADTVRATLTFGAQTAAVDNGYIDIQAVVRSNGASGVMAVSALFEHALATTGLDSQQFRIFQTTPAAFDMTVANSIWGLCCNPGASGVWTFQNVTVQAVGI